MLVFVSDIVNRYASLITVCRPSILLLYESDNCFLMSFAHYPKEYGESSSLLNKIKDKVSLNLNDTLSFLDILLGITHRQFNIYCLMAGGLTASDSG